MDNEPYFGTDEIIITDQVLQKLLDLYRGNASTPDDYAEEIENIENVKLIVENLRIGFMNKIIKKDDISNN